MSSRRTVRQLLVAVLVGVLVGGGLMAVTPAGAEVSSALATNWKKIWKKELKPLADKRYYTKKQSDGKYQPKGSYETAGSGYTKAETYSKAEADAKYQPKGSYALNGSSYTKAESDGKYAPYPALVRGVYFSQVSPNTGVLNADMNFGVELASPPLVHYIASGSPVPDGCSGTVAQPNATAGHLCVFESGSSNINGQFVFNPATVGPGSLTFGAEIIAYQTAAGSNSWFRGTWALRPSGLGAPPAPARQSAPNRAVSPDASVR